MDLLVIVLVGVCTTIVGAKIVRIFKMVHGDSKYDTFVLSNVLSGIIVGLSVAIELYITTYAVYAVLWISSIVGYILIAMPILAEWAFKKEDK